MTYREYLQKSDFERVWKCLQNDFGEASELRSKYEHLFEAVKQLPTNPSNEVIVITGNPPLADLYAKNMLDSQEELVDREISSDLHEMGYSYSDVAALLLYWSSLYDYETRTERENRVALWVKAAEWMPSYPGEPRPSWWADALKIRIEHPAATKSLGIKRWRFWRDALFMDSADEYSYNLDIIRKKLEYNIGYYKHRYGYPGTIWNRLGIDRMNTARALIRIVTNNMLLPESKYVNALNASRYNVRVKDWENLHDDPNIFRSRLYKEKAYQLLWFFLAHNMKMWHDD